MNRFTCIGVNPAVQAEVERLIEDPPDVHVIVAGERDLLRLESAVAAASSPVICAPGLSLEDARLLRRAGARAVLAAQSAVVEVLAERVAAEFIRVRAPRFEGLVGGSPAMRDLHRGVRTVATHPDPVLVLGPTGTGKELVARALHAVSRRAGNFVPVNCAALAADVVESELFGHTAGAFTGARGARTGLFAEADGGTLFLDEFAELPLGMQAKLLRAIEYGEVRPIGADRARHCTARIVLGTNKDLDLAVREGVFRLDLRHRVSGLTLRLPPLAARRVDIPLLADHFLAEFNVGRPTVRFPEDAYDRLFHRSWPGNVRELRNTVRNAAIYADAGSVASSLVLQDEGRGPMPVSGGAGHVPFDVARDTLADVELRAKETYLRELLAAVRGDRAEAMARAGMKRSSFYKLLADLGIREDA